MSYLVSFVVFLLSLFINQPLYADSLPVAGRNLQVEDFACSAYDLETFNNCLQEVKTKGTPLIKITKPITCESKDQCDFNITNMNSGFTIHATNPANKFLRKNDYTYSLFTVDSASRVEFNEIYVEDEDQNPCQPGVVCPAVITVRNSNNISFNYVSFLKTHGTSISVSESKNTTIANSNFLNSFKSAIEISSAAASGGVVMSKNNFENNADTAVIFQSPSDAGKKSQIFANRFINNHSKGAYSNCTFPCTGSQLKISGPSSNLIISKNYIIGGVQTVFDLVGLFSSGLEIGNQNLLNVTVYCNEIAQNRGSGIVQAPPFSNLSGISIYQNKIWGNGLNVNVPVGKIDQNNCYTSDCKLECLNGK